MTKNPLLPAVFVIALASCAGQAPETAPPQTPPNEASNAEPASAPPTAPDTPMPPMLPTHASEHAVRLALDSLIVDTHIDVPYRVLRSPVDVSVATHGGDFDYPRARRGGLNAPFMSVYIPASVDEAGEAFAFANELIDQVEAIGANAPDKFAVATCTADVETQFGRGLVSLPMGMENGGPINSEISNLEHFYDRGIRYITLAHSKSNHISDSSYDDNEAWAGLSPFGRELIGAMNRLGVIVDVSHISDAAFWQVLETSQVPVLASHSSLRHFTPGFHRNMSDDMVRALAEQGGIIAINFGSGFLTKTARDYSIARTDAIRAYKDAQHLEDDDPILARFMAAYADLHPYPFADLNDVLDHIDRVVEIAGIDHVGLGSDYDGVGDTLPVGLKDASTFPNLVQGLLDRGYSDEDIVKLLGANTMRLWRAVEEHATAAGTELKCREL